MKSRTVLWIECVALFVMIPGLLAFWQNSAQIPFFPILLGMFLLVLLIGIRDPKVSFRLPRDREPLLQALKPYWKRYLLVAIGLFGLTALLYPDLLLRLPRQKPGLWALILLLYPLLSVAPQEILFHSYFMQRYQPLFGNQLTMVLVNAIIFAWAHALFLNWVAPLLSLVAGYLLADTWNKTRDFRLVCIEHALYGQLVFTSGIGWFFYTGSAHALERMSGG